MYVLVIIQALEKGEDVPDSICNGCGPTIEQRRTEASSRLTLSKREPSSVLVYVTSIFSSLLRYEASITNSSSASLRIAASSPGTGKYHSQASYACIRIPYNRALLFVRLLIGDPTRTSATSELRSACHIQVPAPLPLPPSALTSLHPLPSIQALL